MATIETVRIKHPSIKSGVFINKSDFDPSQHQLCDEPAAPAVAPASTSSEPTAAAPNDAPPNDVKARLAGLSVVELQEALLEADSLEQVALAEQVENERDGGPRKGALKAIEDRRAELQAQQQ
jgi:hypothetical protein